MRFTMRVSLRSVALAGNATPEVDAMVHGVRSG
jgi:hypothetical protein